MYPNEADSVIGIETLEFCRRYYPTTESKWSRQRYRYWDAHGLEVLQWKPLSKWSRQRYRYWDATRFQPVPWSRHPNEADSVIGIETPCLVFLALCQLRSKWSRQRYRYWDAWSWRLGRAISKWSRQRYRYWDLSNLTGASLYLEVQMKQTAL